LYISIIALLVARAIGSLPAIYLSNRYAKHNVRAFANFAENPRGIPDHL